jgi:DNA-binding SARP family transcriptional activator
MEFLILGPLEVRSDDGLPVRVRASKQRMLLAMLLLHANTTVTDQALVDAIWETEPPPSAVANLRTYASAVRRLLSVEAAATGARLLTQAGGYLLEVDPERLDLLRWRRLVDRGTAAHRRGDLAGAVDELAEASALWRGRPLGDLELHGALQAEVAALDEQRLEALEALVDARLGLGEHAELAVDLRRLVAEHPFHERFWELSMLALYRSGRQAEALTAYQEARQLLIGELGVEPGPELQRLERAILSADPALRPSPPEAAGTTATAPRQLPPDVAGFTGREDLLAVLGRLLAPANGADGGAGDGAGRGTGTAVAAIAGTAGVGKTALAVHAAHIAADNFPDGQLYANLHGASAGLQPLQPLDVLGRFLRALGTDPSGVPAELDEASAMFRSELTDQRLLVVLDNAADAAQVAPLLPAASGCGALVTSRQLLTGLDSATHLQLDVLPAGDAVALLGRLVGQDRMAAEPDAAAEVARFCGWLPLALRIAGGRLAARPSWPVSALAERLGDAQRRLDELELGEAGVRASFAVSWAHLDASAETVDRAAAELFGMLGLLDSPEVGVPVVARLLDQPEDAAERALERLVDAQLLETPAPGRYRLHDLLRLYARELAGERHPAPERAAALTRALGLYVAAAWDAFELVRPGNSRLDRADDRWRGGGPGFDDQQAALAWLEAERSNLLIAIRQAAATPGVPPEIIIQIAHALFGFFLVRGHLRDWALVNQAALRAARELGDRAAEALAHNDLGLAQFEQGRYAEAVAHHQQTLAIGRDLGDRHVEAASLNNLGLVYERQGRYDESAACQQESLAIKRELGDRGGQAISLSNLGYVQTLLGRYEEAVACQRESLAIHRDTGDRRCQAISLGNLGVVYERMGRYDEAVTCQRENLAIRRELGDRRGEAYGLHDLGIVYRRQGRPEESLASLRESLAIRRDQADPYGQADSLKELGITLRALGRPDEARTHLRQALTLFEELQTTDADQVRALLAERAGSVGPTGRADNPVDDTTGQGSSGSDPPAGPDPIIRDPSHLH